MTQKIIAVIPARGGSKRLPRKNIIPFLGKPMVAHTIKAALETGLFERTVVSSEDEEILRIAGESGADLEKRSPELATDTATVSQVCRDLLHKEQRRGRNYDVLCVLYATAPLRTSKDIKTVVDMVLAGKCETALATTEYTLAPNQALRVTTDNTLRPMWPDVVDLNSKDMPPLCAGNGSTYAVKVDNFMKNGSFLSDDTLGYMMPVSRSVDINTIEDLELAKYYADRLAK